MNLYCPLVICLARVELDLGSDIVSLFTCKTASMNPETMIKFLDIPYGTVLLSLFISKYCNSGLLGLISTYFGTVETNSYGKLHLYCLA